LKTPFCNFDLKTGVLCPNCSQLIEKGAYTMLDFEISRIFLNMEKTYPFLEKAVYVKSIEVNGLLIIILRGISEAYRGLLRQVEHKISRLNLPRRYKNIRIIIDKGDPRFLVEQLVSPAHLVSYTVVWFPDGSSEYVFRVKLSDMRRIPLPLQVLNNALSKILGKPAKIAII